jgi:hypothetical protein
MQQFYVLHEMLVGVVIHEQLRLILSWSPVSYNLWKKWLGWLRP